MAAITARPARACMCAAWLSRRIALAPHRALSRGNRRRLPFLTVEEFKNQLNSTDLLSSPLQVAIDDGLLSLTVEEIKGTDVVCRVNNTVMLGETKGINLPVTLNSEPYTLIPTPCARWGRQQSRGQSDREGGDGGGRWRGRGSVGEDGGEKGPDGAMARALPLSLSERRESVREREGEGGRP
jgi:hypothetical protein